jgi:phospholipid transport system transporter-binding protein
MRTAADEVNLPRAKIQRQDTRTYSVQGVMTFDSVTDLWRQSMDMFSGEAVLQIDLAQVTHTDSAGLALLVEWMREASRQSARIDFLHLPAQMLALAEAANLEQVLVGKRGLATS